MAHEHSYNLYKNGLLYSIKHGSDNEVRADKDLIEVIEKLGEKANGMLSKISITEIPDGVEWEIDDYDGMEHVAEKHRTW